MADDRNKLSSPMQDAWGKVKTLFNVQKPLKEAGEVGEKPKPQITNLAPTPAVTKTREQADKEQAEVDRVNRKK